MRILRADGSTMVVLDEYYVCLGFLDEQKGIKTTRAEGSQGLEDLLVFITYIPSSLHIYIYSSYFLYTTYTIYTT